MGRRNTRHGDHLGHGDALIWAASQIVEARRRRTAHVAVFSGGTPTRDPYLHRAWHWRARLSPPEKAALDRLQSTMVATFPRARSASGGCIASSWIERMDGACRRGHGNADGIDLIVLDWFYRAVLDDALVLTSTRSRIFCADGRRGTLALSHRPQACRPPVDGLAKRLRVPAPSFISNRQSLSPFKNGSPSSCGRGRPPPVPSRLSAAHRARSTGGREVLAFSARRNYPPMPVDTM